MINGFIITVAMYFFTLIYKQNKKKIGNKICDVNILHSLLRMILSASGLVLLKKKKREIFSYMLQCRHTVITLQKLGESITMLENEY